MRGAREIIRLKSSSVSTHEIARRLGLARIDGAGDIEAGGRRGPVLAPSRGDERPGGRTWPTPIGSPCSSTGRPHGGGNKRLTARLRAAKLRQQAMSIEDVDYRAARGL